MDGERYDQRQELGDVQEPKIPEYSPSRSPSKKCSSFERTFSRSTTLETSDDGSGDSAKIDREWPLPLKNKRASIDTKQGSSIVCTEALSAESHMKTGQPSSRTWQDTWTLEILSCILATLSLLAIVILLAMHQNNPLPKWPSMITINSLLSVFSTLMRMGLVLPLSEGIGQMKWHWFRKARPLSDMEDLDAASRGALGSFYFLFRRQGSILAYLGAFLTVIMLITDPFVQQLVHYDNCPQPVSGSIATIARSNTYSMMSNKPENGVYVPDHAMAVAINTGIVNPAADPAKYVAVHCVTGNCTFSAEDYNRPEREDGPTYESLGLCSSCTDISDQIQEHTGQRYSDGYPEFVLHGSNDQDPDLVVSVTNPLATTFVGTLNESIGMMKALYHPPADGDELTKAAYSCELYPCLKTYHGSVVNGELRERMLDTRRIGVHRAFGTGGHGFENLGETGEWRYISVAEKVLKNSSYIACEGHAEDPRKPGYVLVALDNLENAPMNATLEAEDSIEGSGPLNATVEIARRPKYLWYLRSCIWALDDATANSFVYGLKEAFYNQSLNALSREGNLSLLALYGTSGDDLTLDRINAFWENITGAMTAVMRANERDGPADYAYGTTLVNDTCASVEWVWITLPAIVVVGVAVFLTLLIMTGPSRTEQPLWKSSALAMLLTDVQLEEKVRAGGMMTLTELERVAKETRVKFSGKGGRMKLA